MALEQFYDLECLKAILNDFKVILKWFQSNFFAISKSDCKWLHIAKSDCKKRLQMIADCKKWLQMIAKSDCKKQLQKSGFKNLFQKVIAKTAWNWNFKVILDCKKCLELRF